MAHMIAIGWVPMANETEPHRRKIVQGYGRDKASKPPAIYKTELRAVNLSPIKQAREVFISIGDD